MSKEVEPGQVKFSLDKETLLKIGKGALIALVGGALTYLVEYITGIDFGEFTPAVVAVCSILVNAVREYTKGV